MYISTTIPQLSINLIASANDNNSCSEDEKTVIHRKCTELRDVSKKEVLTLEKEKHAQKDTNKKAFSQPRGRDKTAYIISLFNNIDILVLFVFNFHLGYVLVFHEK